MPQMAPLNWLTLLTLFNMMFLMFIIMNYYNFNKQPKIQLVKKNNFKMNWKW